MQGSLRVIFQRKEGKLDTEFDANMTRYRKNRGGHVFLTGSTKVDFGNQEFLETQASRFIIHQVTSFCFLYPFNKYLIRKSGNILIGGH